MTVCVRVKNASHRYFTRSSSPPRARAAPSARSRLTRGFIFSLFVNLVSVPLSGLKIETNNYFAGGA